MIKVAESRQITAIGWGTKLMVHKTNGEFTCRTELMIKVAESRQITAIGWGRGEVV